jgi:two-component system NarL family sensor kinase
MANLSDTEKLRQRNRDLSILNDIARGLNQSVDLAEALQTTLVRVAELLGLHTGWVWLLNEENGQSYLAASKDLPPALTEKPQRMEGTCYCLDTFRAGDLSGAANVNVVTCSRLKNLVDGTGGLRYHASIPLYAHGKKLGVLNVASKDWRELSADDLRLLYTVGDLLGIAVERARLYDQSSRLGAVEERNRLAREIHDTLAQGLTAVSLHLESADALLDVHADPERIQRAVRQALTLTRANLEEARRSVLDLRAAPLRGRGLVEALRELAALTARQHGLELELRLTGATRPLPPRLEMGLYRMAQEALNNAGVHAQATRVIVELITTPAESRLIVQDNGRGFDPQQVGEQHFGLTGLNERAKLLGGQLQLKTEPGAGTRLEITIPAGSR